MLGGCDRRRLWMVSADPLTRQTFTPSLIAPADTVHLKDYSFVNTSISFAVYQELIIGRFFSNLLDGLGLASKPAMI